MQPIDDLHTLQRLIAGLVAQPRPLHAVALDGGGLAPGSGMRAVVVAHDERAARDKLAIHQRMYFARLHDSLAEDFPAVRCAMGRDAFARLCVRYLEQVRSRGPNLRDLGRWLPRTLARRTDVRPDLAELARLERARCLAFDAADEAPLSVRDLASLVADPAPTLGLSAGAKTLPVRWDVDAVWLAFDRGGSLPGPVRRPGALIVHKHDLAVWHRRIEPGERAAMLALARGTDLAGLCEALVEPSRPDPADAAWSGLRRLLGDGIVVRRGGRVH